MTSLIDTGDRIAVSLLDQADVLAREARRHKRLSAHHRRKAQEFRGRLAALERRLAQMGVRLVIDGAPGEERHGRGPEGPAGGRPA